MRKIFLYIVLLVILLAFGSVSAEVTVEELKAVTSQVLCDCGCPPQSLHDCTCGYAENRRAEIAAQMEAEQLSSEEMLAAYIEEHTEAIRVVPEAKGFSLVAWLGSLIAIPILAILLINFLKRSSKAEALASTPSVSADDKARIQSALKDWDT